MNPKKASALLVACLSIVLTAFAQQSDGENRAAESLAFGPSSPNSRARYFLFRNPDSCAYYLYHKEGKFLKTFDTLNAEFLLIHAILQTSKGQVDSALIYNSKALKMAELEGDHSLITEVLLNKGRLLQFAGELKDAECLFLEIDSIIDQQGFTELKSQVLNGLSYVNNAMGRYDETIRYGLEAMKTASVNNNPYEEARAMNYVGLGYINRGNYPQATALFLEAAEINKREGFMKSLGYNYNNLALISQWTGNQEEALAYYQKANEICHKTGSKRDLALNLHNTGDVFQNLGNFEKALEVKMEALYLYEELGLESSYAVTNSTISDVYLQMHDYNKAEMFAEAACEYALKQGNKRQSYYGFLFKSRAEFYQNKFVDAYHHQETAYAYRDSMVNEQYTDKIAHYRILYESEKTEKELEQKRNEAAFEKKQAEFFKSQRIAWGAGSLLLVGVMFLMYVLYHAKLKRKTQELFSRQLILNQEMERKRIARELHDGVGQGLSVIKNRLAMADDIPIMATTIEYVQQVIDETRQISRHLHPVELENLGLLNALKSLTKRVEQSSGLFISHDFAIDQEILSETEEINIYRIVQECLNNIVKHAHATAVKISLVSYKFDNITLHIRDNGKGFLLGKIETGKSLGLKSIEERAKILDGSFQIESKLGQGTSCFLTFKLKGT